MNNAKLTHLDDSGAARMVDVGQKPVTRRTAIATAKCQMRSETGDVIRDVAGKKGDVLQVARIAGISAAKRTDELIPLCHCVPLDTLTVTFNWIEQGLLEIRASSVATARTGVEMEAMVAASISALTVYDMCKAIDRSLKVISVELLEKTGGVHGDYRKS